MPSKKYFLFLEKLIFKGTLLEDLMFLQGWLHYSMQEAENWKISALLRDLKMCRFTSSNTQSLTYFTWETTIFDKGSQFTAFFACCVISIYFWSMPLLWGTWQTAGPPKGLCCSHLCQILRKRRFSFEASHLKHALVFFAAAFTLFVVP